MPPPKRNPQNLTKIQQSEFSKEFEEKIGVNFAQDTCEKIGYLANVKPSEHKDPDGNIFAALLMYFITEEGEWSKALFLQKPYFYILCEQQFQREIIYHLDKQYGTLIDSVDLISKVDLDQINHLSGITQKYIKLSFKNESNLNEVKSQLLPLVKKNQKQKQEAEAYEGWFDQGEQVERGQIKNFLSKIIDIREYDVSLDTRIMIDNEIRCSFWYKFSLKGAVCTEIEHLKDKLDKPDLRVMAYDIECVKEPLKFPNSQFDQIMMISFIIDGQGYLIVNREIVAEDIYEFQYAPKAEYDVGTFTIFNENDEFATIKKFFDFIVETKPFVLVTYNGDLFDWKYVQDRAKILNMKMENEIGVFDFKEKQFSGMFSIHMDCLYWVNRDAYLPMGSRGLKKVTEAKLGYEPIELDPELMTPKARDNPQELAEYSVSDAVATYFLYMKHIHDFIFALCTIIPTCPDQVLRRGSGKLCEFLLMAQAFRNNIIFPNCRTESEDQYYNGKLISYSTYTGGHVECLRTGVYRKDLPVQFHLDKNGYQELIDKTEEIINHFLNVEQKGVKPEDCNNYEEIKAQIVKQLVDIQVQCPAIKAKPLIYHVDVAAMYPNIILSNRLQPTAIVNEQICAGCIHNKEENDCKRQLTWQWRGDVRPINRQEVEKIKSRQQDEIQTKQQTTRLDENILQTQKKQLEDRIKKFCALTYGHTKKTVLEDRTDTVCMREMPFFVDTVRDFRDRRYEFKGLVKTWGKKLQAALKTGVQNDIETAKNRIALYESLQLAHKIILNSFYGYVMKVGARWYSMEMAAMVTYTGGSIIMDSRSVFDKIGMPLELDTDGIWTLLPQGFPENFTFELKDGSTRQLSFPCTMCNLLIYDKYGNKQYQTLTDSSKLTYSKHFEMSVEFEIDGPYRCMIIPASKEENKMLKKRYAVFNDAGKRVETKGFEIKRRGELQIIKVFQEDVFMRYLEGATLQECYDSCGMVAEQWYDILDSKGEYVDDEELLDYICEEKVISKSIDEYGTQKSTAITCAKRLAELLGPEILKGTKTNLKYIISRQPAGFSVAQRAIPTDIFKFKDEHIKRKHLRNWTGDTQMQDINIRHILDWEYYKDRLGGNILKMVTIPAALQQCLNPVPKIQYPDWLHKQIKQQNDSFKQVQINKFFKVADIEDITRSRLIQKPPVSKAKLAIHSERQEARNKKPEAVEEVNMDDCPAPDDDFGTWLSFQKKNWKKIRNNFKNETKVTGNSRVAISGMATQMNTALTSFMRNMDSTILNSVWNIVSIANSFEPGVLKVWAITPQGNMFKVNLNINKQIFINSKVNVEDPDFKQVNKILPRNRKKHNLYLWETSEQNYLDKFSTIKYQYLLNNNIEGVYETKVTALFRALIEMNTLVKPKKNIIRVNEQVLSRKYNVKEFESKSLGLKSSDYLPDDIYEVVYLSHAYKDKRHFWVLFIEATKEVCFYVANPVQTSKNQQSFNLASFFQTVLAEKGMEEDFDSWQATDYHFSSTLNEALKHIDVKLQEHKKNHRKATLAVLSSDFTADELQFQGLPNLINEYPVLKITPYAEDSDFPSLDWVRFACKQLISRQRDIVFQLGQKVDYARYTQIPVCNLGDDTPIAVIDTLLGRKLQQNNHLVWYSETGLPDLGGHEDKNFRSYFHEEIENPIMENKGFYRNYTVEVELHSLAINTILQSDSLPEFDDANQLSYIDNKKKGKFMQEIEMDLDEYVTCGSAFKHLKILLTEWNKDICRDEICAELMIQNLFRWLTSETQSKMNDPLLYRLVHKLMRKTFFQLLYKLKQLNCEIVHASFNKLLLHTKKTNFEEAQSHINFVIKTIQEDKDNMFTFITMVPVEYWRTLLYKDSYNFTGFKESIPEQPISRWNISNHLPLAIQTDFKRIAAEFVIKVYRHNQRRLAADTQLTTTTQEDMTLAEGGLGAAVGGLMDIVEDFKKQADHEYICQTIEDYFSRKLLSQVDSQQRRQMKKDVQAVELHDSDDEEDSQEDGTNVIDDDGVAKQVRLDEEIGYHDNDFFLQDGGVMQMTKREMRLERERQMQMEQWEFPQKVGSYNTYTKPALEYVKMVCNHIFGLDIAFQHSNATLKRNLLRAVYAKEFSDEVKYGQEPSLILVVPNIICTHCNKSQDVDICRDLFLSNPEQYDQKGQLLLWSCDVCFTPLNLDTLEKKLIENLNRRVVAYQMQDLKCMACKMISNQLMSERCTCTGLFKQTQGNISPEKLKNPNLLNSQTDIRIFVRLLRNFADLHEMSVLRVKSDQILTLLNLNKK